MEEVADPANLNQCYKRVKADKGGADTSELTADF